MPSSPNSAFYFLSSLTGFVWAAPEGKWCGIQQPEGETCSHGGLGWLIWGNSAGFGGLTVSLCAGHGLCLPVQYWYVPRTCSEQGKKENEICIPGETKDKIGSQLFLLQGCGNLILAYQKVFCYYSKVQAPSKCSSTKWSSTSMKAFGTVVHAKHL